jgi:CRP/FNR family transcriptional regulator
MINRPASNYDCSRCTIRNEGFFCALKDESLTALNAMRFTAVYPKGATLFHEGEDARGVYIVCSGRVKLVASSSAGRTLIAKIAGAGEVLGVSAVVLKQNYELTAETLEPVQVTFVRADDFLRFITSSTEVSMRTAQQLSSDCQQAHNEIRTLGLGRSVRDRFSSLLLDWCNEAPATANADGVRLKVMLTHEEIAQIIGTTRETVTRLLTQFRAEHLIEVKGSTMIVRNPAALEAV